MQFKRDRSGRAGISAVAKFSLTTESARLARFGLVGVLATLVYAAATFVAVEFLVLAAVSASILGQLTSTAVSYFGHLFYSFGVESDHRTYLWRFLVVGVVTFALNGLVTHLLTDVLGINYRVSIVVVAILIPLTNYACNRYWVFRSGIQALAAGPPNPSRKSLGS
jgi:putative flippase GtrA